MPEDRSRLRIRDALAIAVHGSRARRLRAALTATGIAIGIAAMVAVIGISAASRAALLADLNKLGTDLLTVTPGQSFVGTTTPLAHTAATASRRVADVEHASAVAQVDDIVRRTDLVPRGQSSGIRVMAGEPGLADTLGVQPVTGRFLDAAATDYPVLVLGATAARRLGVTDIRNDPQVWVGDHPFAVVGILEPAPLAPEIDSTALLGFGAVEHVLGIEPRSIELTSVYVRTGTEALDNVRRVLPRAANPKTPEAVRVSRPSDAIAALAAAETAFTALMLGLGAVALVVGGIGVANVQVIAVLERRSEIGLRRALGATRAHIRTQFLLEAVIISGLGGIAGTILGTGIAMVFAAFRDWPVVVPVSWLVGAVGLAVLIGASSGSYPAARAARISPAEAIRPQ